jgi:hypothetical protein
MNIQRNITAAAVALLVATPMVAEAATVTFLAGLPTNPMSNPAPVSTTTNTTSPGGTLVYYDNVVGDQLTGSTRVARDAWEGSSLAGNTEYSSVSGNNAATFSFGKQQTSLRLVWGSPDNYNNLHFLLGASVVETVNGGQAQGPVAVRQQWVDITDVIFDGLTFETSKNAFEFASLETTPVPLPAAGWLLIGAFGGLGLLRRRAKA